jgi:hypothetical protein
MPLLKIITFFILLFFISCSSPTDSDWSDFALSTQVIDEKIIITNNTNRTLYLFIVERGIIGEWVPHFDEPKVQKFDTIIIEFSEIYYLMDPLKSGDEIIIYFWDDSVKSGAEIHNKLITLK